VGEVEGALGVDDEFGGLFAVHVFLFLCGGFLSPFVSRFPLVS
jgi:hypothetical protein